MFPSRECAEKFLGFIKNDQIQDHGLDLINDYDGTTQDTIANLTRSTKKFWVNAIKDSSNLLTEPFQNYSLYKYEGDSPYIYHMTSDNQEGDCLTYAAEYYNTLIIINNIIISSSGGYNLTTAVRIINNYI